MGRLTASVRQRVSRALRWLWKRYRASLKDDARREALDDLLRAMDSEMAAILYWGHFYLFDMLVLTASPRAGGGKVMGGAPLSKHRNPKASAGATPVIH